MCRVCGIKGTILHSINSVHHFPAFHLDFPFPGNGDICILDYSLVSKDQHDKKRNHETGSVLCIRA